MLLLLVGLEDRRCTALTIHHSAAPRFEARMEGEKEGN
jgi:hypothetical protein